MTVKLIVLYTQPDDPAAFDEHYRSVHGPLVEKLPGLDHWESAKIVAAADGGEQTYYHTAALWFSSPEAMQAAMGSDEGKATAEDYGTIAPPGSRMFVTAVD
ncbi:MAG TPA: EthD family reductase [Mycobacteriales bacterium]